MEQLIPFSQNGSDYTYCRLAARCLRGIQPLPCPYVAAAPQKRNVVTKKAQLVLSKVRHAVRELVERPHDVHQRLQQFGRQVLHHVVSG